MKKNWVIWIGCACLFGVGAILGRVIPDTKFFEVGSIHDLADIVAAVATSFAVCLAISGLNAWKRQIVATSDHELARRTAIMLQRYRFVMANSIYQAGYVSNMVRNNSGSTRGLEDEIKGELDTIQELHSELRALALECGAVWGKSAASQFEPLFTIGKNIQTSLQLYLNWSKPDQTEKLKDIFSFVATQMSREFPHTNGLDDRGERDAMVERLFAPIDEILRLKFLR